MTEQYTVDKPKTRCISHQSSPVCARRKLAGFADKSTSVAPTQTQTRNAQGTEIGTRYRYIDDTPLVPFNEKGTGSLVVGSGSSTSAAGANSTSAGATAKTRSRPSNEYVLYAYGEPVAVSADGNTSYFGTDILGSVRNTTDKYGAVQSEYNYDAFGNPYLSNLDNDMSFGYCGKIYDNGTGLYDYGFRDYAPNQARFTTIDPIRDGANWFAYVVNDPVNYIDPFGLTPTDSKTGGQYTQDHVNKTYTLDINDKKAFDSVASIMTDMQNEGYTAIAVTADGKAQTFTQYSQMLNYYNDNFKTTNTTNYSVAVKTENPYVERNQIKSSKTAYLDFSSQSSSSGEAFNFAVGAATVSSEYIGNKYLVLTGECNFLTYGLGYSNTDNKIGGETSLNFASITGTIGLKNLGKNNDKGFSISGGLGISLGAEIYKTNNSFAIDLAPFFVNLRVEYTGRR